VKIVTPRSVRANRKKLYAKDPKLDGKITPVRILPQTSWAGRKREKIDPHGELKIYPSLVIELPQMRSG